jgi:hypothetical protein
MAIASHNEAPEQWLRLAQLFADLGRELLVNRPDLDAVLTVLTHRAVEVIDLAEHAGVTRSARTGGFETVAATSDIACQVDDIQYELGDGPCIDAAKPQGDSLYYTGCLDMDERWPEFGKRAAGEIGIHSMLSVRFFLEEDNMVAGLNIYASELNAFGSADHTVATLLATHGALAVTAARRQGQVDNLNRALQSNRQIGVAIGIVMATFKVTQEQAFNLLRVASQSGHRRLADVADDVRRTGTLTIPQLAGNHDVTT